MLDRIAAAWRATRKAVSAREAMPSYDALVETGLVIIRASGEALDERVALSVFARVERWRGDRDGIEVMMFDGIVFDALPIVFRDPFDELRGSVFTGAHASDEALAATVVFYQQAYAALSPRHPFVAEDHVHALVRQVCDTEDSEVWAYPSDTPPLSMLARRVLLQVLYLASSVSREPHGVLTEARRLIAHGRLLELIDPRDGAL